MKWSPILPTVVERQYDVTWCRRHPELAWKSIHLFIQMHDAMGYKFRLTHPRPSTFFLVAVSPHHTGHPGVLS